MKPNLFPFSRSCSSIGISFLFSICAFYFLSSNFLRHGAVIVVLYENQLSILFRAQKKRIFRETPTKLENSSLVHRDVLKNPLKMKASNALNMIMAVLLALSNFYSQTESETSYTWRLDAGIGKIMPDTVIKAEDKNQELMLDILMSTVTNPEGMWKKTASVSYCSNCAQKSLAGRNNRGIKEDNDDLEHGLNHDAKDEELDCGKPVNFTYYDHLVGIQTRSSHPHIPEPEVASTFRSLVGKSSKATLDIDLIERKLKKFKRDKPKSVDLYNQIGNFWRIKGDTYKSIECFRRALAVSPNNADILLNLARVLFNLQYLDDAIFLTRRSLEVRSSKLIISLV